MANYNCTVRSNYFRVKDPDAFKSMMAKVQGCEDDVALWEEKDANGNPVYGFGCYGGIAGLPGELEDEGNDDEYPDLYLDDDSYDRFVAALQECVAEDDAVIIMESGNEKLRCVVGSALVITSKEIEYLNVAQLAVKTAGRLLGNEKYETQLDY